jgi:hypothetical protein
MLPDHQLWMGWEILEIFDNEFENFPVEWRRAVAEGFFTLSRQLQPRSRGDTETNTPKRELRKILTWEYFHEEEPERELTDSEFSGLDWMAMAWSLHLAQQSGRKTEASGQEGAQSWNLTGSTVNEEFVLRALCKLLDAAPYYRIIPIISKLREFAHWFDDTDLHEYRSKISSRIDEAVRRHQEFHKFHCSLRM